MSLEERIDDLEEEIDELEKEVTKNTKWRQIQQLLFIISIALLVLSLSIIFV